MMGTKSTYTTGPWHWELPDVSDQRNMSLCADDTKDPSASDYLCLVRFATTQHCEPYAIAGESAANTKLIAAAPELLQALQLLSEAATAMLPGVKSIVCDLGLVNAAFLAAEQAIAKATK